MASSSLRRVLARLPRRAQHTLRELHVRAQLVAGRLVSEEPDVSLLPRCVRSGDAVLDVGANLGTYTLALARLVGPRGRVIAVEPMPSTFALLAANVAFAGFDNVTLLNLAASDRDGPIPISVPRSASDDTENLYQAHVSAEESNSLLVRACRLDNMLGDLPLSFVKIDVEGHESETLAGMIESLRRFRPRLLVECPSASSLALLEQLGYRASTLPGSPNTWFETESTRGAPDRTS